MKGEGERFFDDSLRGGDGIRNLFLLIINRDRDSSSRAAAAQLCESLKDIVELRFRFYLGQKTFLVRPDGYVAYSSHSGGIAALNAVRLLLERHTHGTPGNREASSLVGSAS